MKQLTFCIAAIMITGCASKLDDNNMNYFSQLNGYGEACLKSGFINAQSYGKTKVNIRYALETWDYDHAEFLSRSNEFATHVVDKNTCSVILSNMHELDYSVSARVKDKAAQSEAQSRAISALLSPPKTTTTNCRSTATGATCTTY